VISIDKLPDEVLLKIFDFYVNEHLDGLEYEFNKHEIEEWQTLVHVCRRWRSVVFGSPRRLNLRLVCFPETPARDTLNVWPSLPLLIRDSGLPTEDLDLDDIIAVLERSDRIVKIDFSYVNGPEWENVLATMRQPFPELTFLSLTSQDGMVSVLPYTFLGAHAPRLQSLNLTRIPFPGLPILLLYAKDLVQVSLDKIPHSGYFSPEKMIIAVSTLTSLEFLNIQFESPLSRPDWDNRRLPPKTRYILPELTVFWFKGVYEYLEDFVARIDAPGIYDLRITLFNQIIIDTP
jgi:F-box-like